MRMRRRKKKKNMMLSVHQDNQIAACAKCMKSGTGFMDSVVFL